VGAVDVETNRRRSCPPHPPTRPAAVPAGDVDLAVLLVPGTSREVLSRLSAGIEGALGVDADVVDLVTSTPVLGFEIVAHGRRIFERDALAADEAEERCLREYLDTEHLRRVQHHYLYGDPL